MATCSRSDGRSGLAPLQPGRDVQGSTWARERDAQREGALARRAAWQRERQDARDELKAQVWLHADVSRRLRAIAARTGLEPEQVLAQLADRVRMDDDGALAVDAFTPRWRTGPARASWRVRGSLRNAAVV